MLSTVLAAYLAVALPQQADERPPRPTDEQLLAALQAKVPDGRILSSAFQPTPRGGGWKGCGLIDVGGTVEPFAVYTIWQQARPERRLIATISAPDENGRMREHPVPPLPAEPAHWKVGVSVPTHEDHDDDGIDRDDRNHDVLSRKMALVFCDTLTPPEGATWATELEPHPDPAREAQINRQARQLTDMIFGAAERRAAD
ncbi:hypothetical protein [Brevundimonas lenta]|uniref:Uncharacterized protein n=1 Tax=Brevundimonas lenta TaxID=424796 RepID=A0A7W6NPY3_9CAUL|nr:hypothetical protein [Brevundimonas lenta]MBB4082655.1 hypothetical protein [Brevundimonas lenta]